MLAISIDMQRDGWLRKTLNGAPWPLSRPVWRTCRAIDAYKLIITSDRSNYNAYVQLGKIYLKRNNFVRAEEYFRAANIFRPEDAEILMLLGDSCYYQKNIEDAEIAYSEAYERAPNPVIKEEIKLKLDKIKLKKRSR